MGYLEVVFEFEGFVAVGAFEFTQAGALVVAYHVALQAVDIGKILLTYSATLHRFIHRINQF